MLQRRKFSCREKPLRNTSQVENPRISPRSRIRSNQQSAVSIQPKRGIMKRVGTFLSIVFVCIVAATAQTGVPPAAQKAMNAIDAEKIRATVKYLSDDALQGR